MNLDTIVAEIKNDEGFSSTTYIDPLVRPTIPKDELEIIEKWLPKLNLTIGYGTLLSSVSKTFATVMLRYRLNRKIERLKQKKPIFSKLPEEAQSVLAQMAYQLGVGGVLKFRNMWSALERYEFTEAAFHMRDSEWWRVDTPERAERLAKRMEAIRT